MQVLPVDHCYSQPNLYKLCEADICIPWRQTCPCKQQEFRCSLGNCIPLNLRCDGLPQCMYGEDEENCYTENNTEATDIATSTITENDERMATDDVLSLPVVVVIASVCVFVCVLMVFLLYIFLTRRQKNNTSRESQSATQPLRKSYITSDVEDTDVTKQAKHIPTEKTYSSRKPEPSQYLPVNVKQVDAEYQLTTNNHVIHYDDEAENTKVKHSENEQRNESKNLAISPWTEIYNIDRSNESKVSGLGKYTFKPRLKYLKSKPYHEIDENDRDKLYVINSYKHCSGKSIVPETLTFDKDPKKFSDSFATDLLCSSTPRQLVKHSLQSNLLNSLESIASLSDTENA